MEAQDLRSIEGVRMRPKEDSLPTFYFDLWDGKRLDPDEYGIDLRGPKAAFEQAVKGARDMLRDALPRRQNTTGRTYHVRDETEETLFIVPLSIAAPDRHYSQA